MIKPILTMTGLLSLAILLQTTHLYHYLGIYTVIPDMMLLLLVFMSIQHGSMIAQWGGFFTGLVMGVLSNGEVLGVHSLAFAVLGYLFGLGKGNVFFDPVFIPMLAGVTATLLKALLLSVVQMFFQLGKTPQDYFNITLLLEMAYNGILAIPFFAVATWVKQKLTGGRRGFHG